MAKPKITVCIGSSCFARGNELNVEVIQKYLEEHHLKDEVDLELQGRSARDAAPTVPSLWLTIRSTQK